MFLDLHLPGHSGLDVLKWLRQQPGFRGLPVIVFTGSPDSAEVVQAYRVGASSFLVKPNGLDELTNCLRQTLKYWLQTSALP